MKTKGIHHITAIAGNPQDNIDFYAGVLGLRLVKKTVNFDAPDVYHFYFGNDTGAPGTILTFFPWSNINAGRPGAGQVGWTTFIIPEGSLNFWKKRLKDFNVKSESIERFGVSYLRFRDPEGLQLELTEQAAGRNNAWSFDGITEKVAIKGFGGAVLFSAQPEMTASRLEESLGFKKINEDHDYIRFEADGDIGQTVDVKKHVVDHGIPGAGTIHHIAFRTEDLEDQGKWQEHLYSHGLRTTQILDRQYFKSIYYREDGGILFEMATDTPGFLIDEPFEELGKVLKLPEWLESKRGTIESMLPEVKVRHLGGHKE